MNSRSSAKSGANRKISREVAIKEAILGKDYELSLVFCNNALSRRLNRTYRGKDKPTNVLAFPLGKGSGEVFINKEGLGGFSVLELYIHALLHLKGMRHGAKMESEEQRFYKLFNGKKSLSRHRHRHSPGKGSYRRRSS
ncbi:rRNA maturation RNase YbeY [Candidatus Parcubacteria bacterium]|nr:rRNA maturation RNase YbeY [Candidatus Parcubacteria bacterium]